MDVATLAYEQPDAFPSHFHPPQDQQHLPYDNLLRDVPSPDPALLHHHRSLHLHLHPSDATRGSPFPATYPPPPPHVSTRPLSAHSWPHEPPSPYQHSPLAGFPYNPDASYAEPSYIPMAAPPQSHTPSGNQQAGSNAAPSPVGTPQSPASQSREQQRIALLLDINVELLQEVNRLQSEGKGGAISVQQQAQFKAQGQPDNLASEEYIQCLRRVQANLGYLMPKAQNDPSKIPQGPVYMTPPPHMAQLKPKYDSLKELFPGWQGMNPRMMAQQQLLQQQQQQQQQMQQQQAHSPTAGNMGQTSANGTPTNTSSVQP